MSDMAVSVRLMADGSGLVGQVNQSSQAMRGFTSATQEAAGAAKKLSAETKVYQSIYTSSWWQDQASRAKEAARAQDQLSQAMARSSVAARAQVQSMGAQRAAAQQLGFQVQDVAVQLSMGTSAGIVFAQQGGQIIQALGMMSNSAGQARGKFAAFASFMGGPWGAAIGVAVTVLGALAAKFFESADAAGEASAASEAFAQRQMDLGNFLDKTTGKLAEQNKYLLQNAMLLRQTRMDSLKQQVLENQQSAFGVATSTRGSRFVSERRANQTTYDLDVERAISAARGDPFRLADELGKLSRSRPDLRAEIEKVNTLAAESTFAAREYKRLQAEMDFLRGDRDVAPGFVPKAEKAGAPRAKKDRSAEQLARFEQSTAERLAGLRDQFNPAPSDIDKAAGALREIDKIVRELETRKPLDFKAMRTDAEALRPLIQDYLARPIREMLDDQERELELGRLRLSGRQADAEALQLTHALMDRLGAESEEQLATELAKRNITAAQVEQLYDNLAAMRLQTREMEAQRAEQQAFLSALDAVQGSIRQSLADLRTRGPKALGDMFEGLLRAADNLFADVVTEQLFGGLFRDLEDQITGSDKVSKAGERMAKAVTGAASDMAAGGNAARAFAEAVNGAAAKIGGKAGAGVADASVNPDIIVTGKSTGALKELKGSFKEAYGETFSNFRSKISDTFEGIFGKTGLFSKSLGATLGTTLANAQIGAAVGKGVTSALGIKGSSMGGAIGGALGGALGGPLGTVVGSIAGSVFGGLFKKHKIGFSTIGANAQGDLAIVNSGGNSGSRREWGKDGANTVLAGIEDIASQFGAMVDAARGSVSIGISGDSYHVDTSGQGRLKKSQGGHDFNQDAQAAIEFAMLDLIRDGVLVGLRKGTEKLLTEASELQAGLQKALRFENVFKELKSIKDPIGAAVDGLDTEFRSLVKVFKEAGASVDEYAQLNELFEIKRKEAFDQLLESATGDLKTLLDDLRYGNLAEGSAADQRSALLGEISKAQANATAGVDGAAAKLADLQRQLVELSRDAFGTAGPEYSADRANAISSAEAIIKLENERIKRAQEDAAKAAAEASAHLATANQLANETNDLLSEINTNLKQGLSGQAPAQINWSAVMRPAA